MTFATVENVIEESLPVSKAIEIWPMDSIRQDVWAVDIDEPFQTPIGLRKLRKFATTSQELREILKPYRMN